MHFNPLASILIALRGCIMDGALPSALTWAGMLGPTLFIVAVGLLIFRHYERIGAGLCLVAPCPHRLPTSSELIVRLDDVGKAFRRFEQKPFLLRNIVKRLTLRSERARDFWPLRHISFDIRRGETVASSGRTAPASRRSAPHRRRRLPTKGTSPCADASRRCSRSAPASSPT